VRWKTLTSRCSKFIQETVCQISSQLPEFCRRYYRKHFGLFFFWTRCISFANAAFLRRMTICRNQHINLYCWDNTQQSQIKVQRRHSQFIPSEFVLGTGEDWTRPVLKSWLRTHKENRECSSDWSVSPSATAKHPKTRRHHLHNSSVTSSQLLSLSWNLLTGHMDGGRF